MANNDFARFAGIAVTALVVWTVPLPVSLAMPTGLVAGLMTVGLIAHLRRPRR